MALLSSAYELVQRLNAGGNTNIFLYRHLPSNDIVVIKKIPVTASSMEVLPLDCAAYKEMHINHIIANHAYDGIVSMRDSFLVDDALHLVFEYCVGGDMLTQLVTSFNSTWTESDAVAVFKQVAGAVNHLHGLEIAHGDISLENILVHDGVHSVKLCDFGLAMVRAVTRYAGVGKLYYMSPEMHLRRPYNALASDRWALGILLFMLVTGRPLFEKAAMTDPTFHLFFHAQAADPATGIQRVLEAHPSSRSVSENAVDLLTKLLRPSASERLSMAQVLAHPLFQPEPPVVTRQRRAASSPLLSHISRASALPLSYFKSITTTM
ncbi:serine/threonine protein kinase [Aphanomyces astaci]|uniref:Serine/threonine protein kinase n=1 Tax=Aphanomyces astaci TaxID=112090 RepID=W4FCY3_APHAT|nr:serine/threonine protein kinase [Aphanomyces astaci]ETV64759.1 serine/threonine protein kinase [Aphanomyces astaci]RQM21796.1 hypothetical protein B5M09_009396 [Aphanomyces astaci]|eukprot:XP_009845742.1 serine/threonine protein kinase [Aphanomyces astaci]